MGQPETKFFGPTFTRIEGWEDDLFATENHGQKAGFVLFSRNQAQRQRVQTESVQLTKVALTTFC
jgi:hypothetical protein